MQRWIRTKAKCPRCKSILHLSCEDLRSQINGLQIFTDDMDPDLALQIDAMFSDLSSLLLAYLSDKSSCFKPLMYRIRMLGRDEASSKPWLVILCPAPVVRHAEAFFQKNQIRQFLAQIDVPGGLEVAYVGRTPKFRSGSWDDVDVAFERTDGHYGRIGSNALVLEQMSELVRATMGGVLVSKNSDGRQAIFGLTVGHLLRHEDAVEAKESTRPQELDAESAVQAKMTREATDSMIGHLAKVSFSKQARNLDWALIEFSKGVHIWRHFTPQLADEVFLPGNCKGSVHFRPTIPCSNKQHISNHPTRLICPWADSFIKVYPVAATIDSKSSSANKTSSGEETPYSTVESRFGIIEADSELPDRETEFGISQPGLELPEGKSGTWVISESHDDASAQKTVVNAHGIAIADDGYGDIYMIPLSDIMADIERVSGSSSISLPHDTDEIARLIQLEHFSLYEDAPSPTLRAPFDLCAFKDPQLSETDSLFKPIQKNRLMPPPFAVWNCSSCKAGNWSQTCTSCGHDYCDLCQIKTIASTKESTGSYELAYSSLRSSP